jgi:peptidoglycan/LPS O-acetylase OafA/YrhL
LRKTLMFLGACGFLYCLNRLARAENFIPPGFILYEGFVRHLFFTFSVGIMSAQLVRVPKIKAFGRSVWAASIGVAFIAFNWYFVPAKYGWVESASLAFPFFAVACGCSYWGALRSRAILFLGQISYSVYLIHLLIFGAVLLPLYRMKSPAMQTTRDYWILFFIMAPAIVGVATLWHRMFELPFLMKGKKVVLPPATDALPLRPAYAVAGGAPVPQRHMHAFALGGDPERGRDVMAVTPGTVPSLRRAGFLPRRSRRTPATRSRVEP